MPKPSKEVAEINRWEHFFKSEADRQVTLGYFVGAEPALEQARLRAAAKHLRYGILGTNGTIRIDRDIPFRIQISIWAADDEREVRLRGAPAYRKAFANYSGDARANMVFTLSSWNLHSARDVARMCQDYGIPLTFNHYSPTHSFLRKLAVSATNDKQYFRLSQRDATPVLQGDALIRARDTIDSLMEEFPGTILYSHRLNELATRPGQLYDVDPETGIAKKCGSRIVGNMSYYKADLTSQAVKCCTPDVDCTQCRMYSGLWSSRLMPSPEDLADSSSFSRWLDLVITLGKVFLYERPAASQHAPAERAEIGA